MRFSLRVSLLPLVCLLLPSANAEVRQLTLREAVDLALKQNPDITLARLDEERARQNVRQARDPFHPRVIGGSGLAYTYGFPLQVDGSPPSIVQFRAFDTFYNRTKSYQVSEARENARAAGIDVESKRDEIAFRAATLYLDVERTARVAKLTGEQVAGLSRVADVVQARVREGQSLPLEGSQAGLGVLRGQNRAEQLGVEQAYLETSLAVVLGFPPVDRVQTVEGERAFSGLPANEEAAIERAVQHSRDLKKLATQISAKQFAVRAQRAAKWPQIDLIAQYALLAPFNSAYENLYTRRGLNALQFGASVTLPVLPGKATDALAAQAEIEVRRLQVERSSARDRVALETKRSFADVRNAEGQLRLAQEELKVAREELSVLLAQLQEGRTALREVEQARTAEGERWIAFTEARYALDRARLAVLRQTGDLLAAIP